MKHFKTLTMAALLTFGQVGFANDVVNLIVPTAPGGGTDLLFRAIAKEAEPHLGATIVIQNIGGAGGTVGVSRLTRSKPDGRTVAGVWMSPLTTSPHTIKTFYSPDDYRAIINLDSAPYVMCVNKEFPADDGRSFIEELKARPDHYTYGTDGVAGPAHLATERIFGALDIKARDIPYGGAGETMPALISKVIDIYVGSIPPAISMLKSGDIKCLLVTSADKSAAIPEAISLGELGIADKELLLWHGLIAPAGMSDQDVARFEAAFRKAADTPAMEKFFQTVGVEKDILDSQAFQAHITQEYEALGKQIEALGLKDQK